MAGRISIPERFFFHSFEKKDILPSSFSSLRSIVCVRHTHIIIILYFADVKFIFLKRKTTRKKGESKDARGIVGKE